MKTAGRRDDGAVSHWSRHDRDHVRRSGVGLAIRWVSPDDAVWMPDGLGARVMIGLNRRDSGDSSTTRRLHPEPLLGDRATGVRPGRGTDLDGNEVECSGDGLMGRVLQHEWPISRAAPDRRAPKGSQGRRGCDEPGPQMTSIVFFDSGGGGATLTSCRAVRRPPRGDPARPPRGAGAAPATPGEDRGRGPGPGGGPADAK